MITQLKWLAKWPGWTRTWWLTLLLILPLLPWTTPVAAQTTPGRQGIMSGWVVDDSGRMDFPKSALAQFPSMRQAGAGAIRLEFRLGQCFSDWTSAGCPTAQGATALAIYDQAVTQAQANQLQVLGLIDYTSWPGAQADWTANNVENNSTERYPDCRDERGRFSGGCNTYIENLAQNAARILASHFDGVNGPLVNQWEIWNEPNASTTTVSPTVSTGGTFIYPSNFAWLLRLSYEAIKAVQPSATVISGGLFAFDITEPQTRNGLYQGPFSRSRCNATLSAGQSGATYLCQTYEMGRTRAGWRVGATPFDQVGQHLYVDQWKRASSEDMVRYLLEMRYAYREYEGEDTRKQIYITECGWTTDSVSAAVQADNLQVAFDQVFRTTPFVGQAYWFSFRDEPDAQLRHGLTDVDGNPKPAFEAYQRYASY